MFQTVGTVTGVVILLALLWEARDALLLVYVSALIAMGLSPLVKLIERPNRQGTKRRVPRWLAILAIYAVLVALVVFVGLLVIPPLVSQAGALWARLPAEFNRFQTFLITHKLMVHRVTLEEAVQNAPTGTGGNAVGTVLVAISSLIGGVTAVAVALTVSPKLALIVGVYFLVLHQLEANVLVPKIMERSVGVSPVAVLVALLVGGALMGLPGAILAIPTAALLSVIIEEIAADREARIQRIK